MNISLDSGWVERKKAYNIQGLFFLGGIAAAIPALLIYSLGWTLINSSVFQIAILLWGSLWTWGIMHAWKRTQRDALNWSKYSHAGLILDHEGLQVLEAICSTTSKKMRQKDYVKLLWSEVKSIEIAPVKVSSTLVDHIILYLRNDERVYVTLRSLAAKEEEIFQALMASGKKFKDSRKSLFL